MSPGSSLGHLSMLLASSDAVPHGILVAGISLGVALAAGLAESAHLAALSIKNSLVSSAALDFATSALKLQANPRKLVASATGKKLLGRDPCSVLSTESETESYF